tara:strand:+ start:284 stop:541 length:258 start_codon:yes stop_codon:yes gene_type:complete
MKKILLFILLSLFLTNCAQKPLINPETSRDKFNGDNISGNYYKDLQVCEYIHRENTSLIIRKLGISDKTVFVKKCMLEYGYSILR